MLKEREREKEREINTWTLRQARISIEMEVWSRSPGSDEQLSSPWHRTVSRTEYECVRMYESCIHTLHYYKYSNEVFSVYFSKGLQILLPVPH